MEGTISASRFLIPLALAFSLTATLRAQNPRVDRAVADGETVIPGLHKDYLSDITNASLPSLTAKTAPIVAQLIAHRSFVEPKTRNAILTTFLFKVISNLHNVQIPALSADKRVPLSLIELTQAEPSSNRYVAITLLGGRVQINGVTVDMQPMDHHLALEGQFLLFLTFNPDGTTMSFGDERSILAVNPSTKTLNPVSTKPIAAISSLTNLTFNQAMSRLTD